jgi:hypothetical protein
MNKEDLYEGMPVVVYAGVPSRRKYDGKVTRVARKYVTIEYQWGSGGAYTLEFDIESQRERGSDYSYAAIFRTPEEHAIVERKHAAEDGLMKLGLIKKRADALTLEEMEAVVELIGKMRAV